LGPDTQLDPDLLVRGMDPRTRIRTKMSKIPNTGKKLGSGPCLEKKERGDGGELEAGLGLAGRLQPVPHQAHHVQPDLTT
jgi:hypothetical protein